MHRLEVTEESTPCDNGFSQIGWDFCLSNEEGLTLTGSYSDIWLRIVLLEETQYGGEYQQLMNTLTTFVQ